MWRVSLGSVRVVEGAGGGSVCGTGGLTATVGLARDRGSRVRVRVEHDVAQGVGDRLEG